MPARWQHLSGLRQGCRRQYILESVGLQYVALCLLARIHRCRNQGVKMGVGQSTITPGDSVVKCLLPAPMVLCSAGMEALVTNGGGMTMIPWNWELRLRPATLGSSCLFINRQRRDLFFSLGV